MVAEAFVTATSCYQEHRPCCTVKVPGMTLVGHAASMPSTRQVHDRGAKQRFVRSAVFGMSGLAGTSTHRPLSSCFLGLPYRILNINHKKELLRGLWV